MTAAAVDQWEELRYHFDRLRPEVEAALEYSGGTHTADDVWEMIVEDKAQLWYGVNSIVITEIVDYPRLRALVFFLAGGKLEELHAMYPLILEWGSMKDCQRATLTGRAGWERTFLKTEGWHPVMTVLEKELTDGQGSDTNTDHAAAT